MATAGAVDSSVARVGLLGAECSGKTTLARQLARRLPGVHVPEALRGFVERTGRTPTLAEQPAILRDQITAEDAALRQAAKLGYHWVIIDPSPLMTAVYSIEYFHDESLVAQAIAQQRRYDVVLWCDIDLPWVPDGVNRDGPVRRRSVHELIGEIVQVNGLAVVPVSGLPERRLRTALGALEQLTATVD